MKKKKHKNTCSWEELDVAPRVEGGAVGTNQRLSSSRTLSVSHLCLYLLSSFHMPAKMTTKSSKYASPIFITLVERQLFSPIGSLQTSPYIQGSGVLWWSGQGQLLTPVAGRKEKVQNVSGSPR